MSTDVQKLLDKPCPCPICERTLRVRISKTSKPYIICDDCGLQMFIRYPKGIDRFKEMIFSGGSIF